MAIAVTKTFNDGERQNRTSLLRVTGAYRLPHCLITNPALKDLSRQVLPMLSTKQAGDSAKGPHRLAKTTRLRNRPNRKSAGAADLFQYAGEGARPARLAVALQHPEVQSGFLSGISNALSVRSKAESNAWTEVSKRAKALV